MSDEVLWAVVGISLIFVLYTLARFSEKLGCALHMKPYYLVYYVASLFIFIDVQIMLWSVLVPEVTIAASQWCNALTAIGMTLALTTTVKYWGWLLRTYR
ncbi:MAG: hypothetical protein U9N46_01930 [Euryarchaeota archaeon]|nr:MAG: hypothetical protein C5S47_03090 [ANME-2 cluster archaeon]MEA1863952.1 hypothetical protein [Euryarchaeota archaeon]